MSSNIINNNRLQSQLFFAPPPAFQTSSSSMFFGGSSSLNDQHLQRQQLLNSIIHSSPFEQRIRSLAGIHVPPAITTTSNNNNNNNNNRSLMVIQQPHHDPLRRDRENHDGEDSSKFKSIAGVFSTTGADNDRDDDLDDHKDHNDDEEEVERIKIDINPTELKNKSANNSNSNAETKKSNNGATATMMNSDLKFKPFRKIASEGGMYGNTTAVAVDYSNKWFATGSSDGAVRAWDMIEGKQRLTFQSRHIGAVRALAISPLSPYMFSAGEDKLLKCWDLEKNEIIREYHGHLSAVYAVATHPRQDIVVSGGRDATVRVWDIRTREAVHVLSGHHTESVMAVATQESTPQLASGGADGLIYLWDIGSGRPITRMTRHKKAVRSLLLHPTENTMVSVAADAVRKWRVPIGEYMGSLTGSSLLQNLSENNVGDDASGSSSSGNKSSAMIMMDTVWNTASYSRLHDCFVVGSESGNLLFCDWSSMKVFYETKTKSKNAAAGNVTAAVLCCSFDQSGDFLVTGEGDKTITQWKSKSKNTGGGGDE